MNKLVVLVYVERHKGQDAVPCEADAVARSTRASAPQVQVKHGKAPWIQKAHGLVFGHSGSSCMSGAVGTMIHREGASALLRERDVSHQISKIEGIRVAQSQRYKVLNHVRSGQKYYVVLIHNEVRGCVVPEIRVRRMTHINAGASRKTRSDKYIHRPRQVFLCNDETGHLAVGRDKSTKAHRLTLQRTYPRHLIRTLIR
ncbi:uncharacterized protein B0H18DRAFT_979557 [Fomitopsis serialis]|uniref:uncharacterized protein n=1 Tax=Fomitopsis serialis TaxID=139415 RepID=UPI0020077192|nr:uncharacterized protein B0H18DRAFT_979557 [Neoantrodia serialis]KAH9934125.1 hypothetical protein B0H18DRAFT_979557 [Neoantrodia serialis]